MKEIVYLNGKFVTKGRAKISPDDRGFNFADGVYEVVKFYKGTPFMWDEHHQRLIRSLAETDIPFEGTGKLKEMCHSLLEQNGLSGKNAGIYLQITRGAGKRVHHFPEGLLPTVYATAFEMATYSEKLKNGVKVITHEDIRWLRCDIKSVSLLPNTMLYQSAVKQGADECILFRDGMLTEATHSSVMGVMNGTVVSHPLSRLILPGITRIAVRQICQENHIPFVENPVNENSLDKLDELFITGTGSEIMPVVQINDKPLRNGAPGPVTRLIQKEFFKKTYGYLGNEPSWWSAW